MRETRYEDCIHYKECERTGWGCQGCFGYDSLEWNKVPADGMVLQHQERDNGEQ